MNLDFRKPTKEDAEDIVTWKYDGEYSFYDNDRTEGKKEYIANIYNEENVFAIYNEKNELMGHCSFDYDDDEDDGNGDSNDDKQIMLGLQMRPELTGKGMGTEIVNDILAFGREKYKFDSIGLLVAKFNKRAIRVYEKLGFKKTDEFTWDVNGEIGKEFLEMRKVYSPLNQQ